MAIIPECWQGGLRQRIEVLLRPALGDLAGLREGRHQGPRQRVGAGQIVGALIGLFVHLEGSLSQVMMRLYHMSISDSALSQRRARMGQELFAQIARRVLGPLSHVQEHSEAFLHGWLLVGIDGSKWSLPNTAQNQRVPKAKTRRGAAAFGKMLMSTLVELGSHAPLGAALSWQHSSEQALSLELLEQLPARSLLVLDRLYGQGPMLRALQEHCPRTQSEFLVRVGRRPAVQVLQRYHDGSAQVQMSLRQKNRPRREALRLQVREVRGQVMSREKNQWVEVRLWSSLAPEQASAEDLLRTYARRWEQELFFRQLKLQLRRSELLQSHTPETAAQELLAMLMACRLIAEERMQAAALSDDAQVRQAAAVRISFAKCRIHMLGLWITLEAGRDILSLRQQEQLIDAVRSQIAREALPKRRSRTCQRKVRQPVSQWPRMFTPTSLSSPLQYQIDAIT
jgi:hypothetical protein